MPRFFSVRVYDEALRGLVRENVEKAIPIRLQGKHCAEKEIDDKGKQRSSSYIRATNIQITASWGQIDQSANDNAEDQLG